MSKRKYEQAAMDAALAEIQQHGGKLRATAKKYGVPKSTLLFKLKNPGHKETFGPRPILTTEEENMLDNWIVELGRKGFPRKKEDLQSSVQIFLNNNPRPNPFKNNRPGDGWVAAFLRRHPHIVKRTSEAVTTASSCVSEKDIRKWFQEISAYTKEKKLEDVINDPTRIFNGDETAFQICPNTGKVLACKGDKNVYAVESGASKENLTVMFSFSASGKVCPPMIIYPYKRIPEKVALSVPTGWGIAKSDNGWMTAEIFFEYVANVFYPYLEKENINLPVIFFVDGHRTHLTYEISKLCSRLKIELIALYPNATRILQPADVSVFRPIKLAWKKAVREWCNHHVNEIITKLNFASILKTVVDTSINPEAMVNGFRVCGLYPFNADNIDFSKCLGKKQTCASTTNNTLDLANTSTITYDKFVGIVGKEKVKQFERINDILIQDENEDFCSLYKIWQYFQDASNTEPQASASVLTDKTNLIQEQTRVTVESGETEKENTLAVTQNYNTNNTQNCSESTNQSNNCNSYNNNKNENNNNDSSTTSLSDISPAFKIISNSDFGNFLVMPKTPERKGKRVTERFPFAITSEKYKDMFKKKNDKKQKLEEEKAERKKKRDANKKTENKPVSKLNIKQKHKKIQKKDIEITQASTSNSIGAIPKIIQDVTRKLFETNDLEENTSTNSCKVCNRCANFEDRLVCDECSKIFHTKCVPQLHQVHIPIDKDDLFMCHHCYKECNTSDDQALGELDVDSDEVSDLYTEYQKYYKNN